MDYIRTSRVSRLLGLITILLLTGSAHAEISSQTAIGALERIRFLGDCPNPIWGGFEIRSIEWIVVDPNNKAAWNLRAATSPKINRVSLESLPADIRNISGYDFGNRDGHGYVAINVNISVSNSDTLAKRIDDLFAVTIHEGFHAYGQSNWTPSEKGGSRGDVFPTDPTPRYYRGMINRSLLLALDIVERADLQIGRAAGWLAMLEKDYSEDLLSDTATDRNEGTADYVELVALARAKYDCNLSRKQLASFAFNKRSGSLSVENLHSVSGYSESYEMGGASLALAYGKASPNELNRYFAENVSATPLGFLLTNIRRETPVDHLPLKEKINSIVGETNTENGARITGLDAALRSSDYKKVYFADSVRTGSFSANAFVTIAGTPTRTLITALTFSGDASATGGVGIEVTERDAYMDQNPCEDQSTQKRAGFILPVAVADMSRDSNGDLRVAGRGIQISAPSARVRESNGYVCIE